MLNWWLGKGAEGSHGQDGNPELEPPETPAPVFAARALKSAIFGTPAPPADDTLYEIDQPSDTMAEAAAKNRLSMNLSPTKPQGILLTPGTATTRRKTVSFGSEVVDTTGLPAGRLRRSGRLEEPTDTSGNERQSNRKASSRASRKPSFTARLENAREGALAKTEPTISLFDAEPQESLSSNIDGLELHGSRSKPGTANQVHKSNSDLLQQVLIPNDKLDGDVTMDLNEPHSQSGKYWKSQYQSYHDEAKVEMQNLLKSKHLIRSYAKTKDGQAVDLAEKLREEQLKVISMESEISKLSARLARAGLDGAEDEAPELIKELARQTAQALKYKAQVDNLRITLREVRSSKISSNETASQNPLSLRSEQTHLDIHQELKEAKEQLRDMAAIRNEIDKMRQTLSTAEANNRNLQEENTRLTADLRHANMRLDKQSEKSEKRRQSFEEQFHDNEEALKTLQKSYDELKEQAKSQRRDAGKLLKERHDQAVEFKKEIASMRGAESTIRDLQQALSQKTSEHDEVVADLQKQIAELKRSSRQEPSLIDPGYSRKQQPAKPVASEESCQSRHSLIPVTIQSNFRPSKTRTASHSETPVGSPQRAHPALSEIINHATVDTVPPRTSGPVHYTPLAKRFSDMTLESPKFELPSLERSPPRNIGRKIPKMDHRLSPRPSMFNITSSPPKMAGNDRGGRRPMSVPSGRLPSLDGSKARNPLPPERAAAARARLEQKNAEKKRRRALETDKENMPS
ncbi:uncharacterized protein BP5553_07286 [Venustampulla echinocandica]|uniref:Spindle pole body-associated protein cut12 domain-containing protein n=1 Tax=Venustampulla echinocandica TaxID=2656787 RepID=A0A370TJ23_9HELO|nr:uncharacterized protein BP5553_07286 [Venustampulla echinocandica]RDL35355.1 hypothetical protein BP5553_07286 [Venustampulla echinocandica]